ncbi:MAG: hypothetical protein QME65_00930, partial [Candidatus Omnitrophota bacterium]|nr:hypothetical protein [Candidatus Omnitrophota bacterium]
MEGIKTKSLRNIEEKMRDLDQSSLRYHVLESAKGFKSSWIELGRALYSVWKDKMYKLWGYATFEAYSGREIGIRKQTAMKLLKSYYFLEKEEPQYLREEYTVSADALKVPTYESVDVLRLAKNKKELGDQDYAAFKIEIFEKGKDHHQLKKDLTALIRQRKEPTSEEAWEEKKFSAVKRLVGTLKSLKREIEISKLLPAAIIKEAEAL